MGVKDPCLPNPQRAQKAVVASWGAGSMCVGETPEGGFLPQFMPGPGPELCQLLFLKHTPQEPWGKLPADGSALGTPLSGQAQHARVCPPGFVWQAQKSHGHISKTGVPEGLEPTAHHPVTLPSGLTSAAP